MQPLATAISAALLLVATATVGCASPAATDEAETASDLTAAAAPSGAECVIDTVRVTEGLLADFRASVGVSFVKQYAGGLYAHLEIPGVFDAALPPNGESGEWFDTILGLDIAPEQLPAGSTAAPRLTATISGGPQYDAALVTSARGYEAAKAIFAAMTRAKETTERHVVPVDQVYDRSWTRVRRASPGGRVVCESLTYPGPAELGPEVSCTFFGIEETHVQVFNPEGTSGVCLAKKVAR